MISCPYTCMKYIGTNQPDQTSEHPPWLPVLCGLGWCITCSWPMERRYRCTWMSHGYHFIPFRFSSRGSFGPAVEEFLSRICQRYSSRAQVPSGLSPLVLRGYEGCGWTVSWSAAGYLRMVMCYCHHYCRCHVSFNVDNLQHCALRIAPWV